MNHRQVKVFRRMPSSPADDRTRLETEKLQAEIEEINARTSDVTSRWSRWHKRILQLAAVVTLLGGVLGGFFEIQAFLEGRARRLDIQLDRQMIELSFRLDGSPEEASNAAVLLSAYEDHAVPILVDHLSDATPTLRDDLIGSLARIMGKKRIKEHPEKVLGPLLRQASAVFRKEAGAPEPRKEAMTNYLEAIERVAAGLDPRPTVETLEELESTIRTADSSVRGEMRTTILKRIGEVKAAVSGAG